MLKRHLIISLCMLFPALGLGAEQRIKSQCQDHLTRNFTKSPGEIHLLEPLSASSFNFHQNSSAEHLGELIVVFQNNPAAFDGFAHWRTEFLTPADLLFEVGLLERDHRPEGSTYGIDLTLVIADKEIKDLLAETLELYLELQKLAVQGAENFPVLTDKDGHTFNSFESWAITLDGRLQRIKRNYKELESLFRENQLVLQAAQNRIGGIVRHLGRLAGARQQIYEYMLSVHQVEQLRHALVEEILPQVELRMGQLHEAYQQRSQVAQQVAESVLEQRERILHLSEILSQLDWISLSGGRVDL